MADLPTTLKIIANGINPCDFAGAGLGCGEKGFICKPHREAKEALRALEKALILTTTSRELPPV